VQVATHGENTGYEVPCLIVAAKDDVDQYLVALQESARVSSDTILFGILNLPFWLVN
jgi:Ras family protein T1